MRYVKKEPSNIAEKDSLKFLITEHNFVIKEYSTSFCRIMNAEDGIQKTDETCLRN